MKNATAYEKKVRKLLAGLGKGPVPSPNENPIRTVIEAVLSEDTPRKEALAALETLESELVDYNELRVAPVKDISDSLGRHYPYAREKAEMLVKALNRIFDKTGSMSMEYMKDFTKRDLRRHLQEIGLSHYAAAYVVLFGFGGHAVAVDRSLAWVLEHEELVHPGSEIQDIQAFLERIIPQKDAAGLHEAIRKHVEKSAKALQKHRAEEAAAVAAEERRQQEAAAKAEAEKRAAREAAEAAAEAKRQAAAKRAAQRAAGGAKGAKAAREDKPANDKPARDGKSKPAPKRPDAPTRKEKK
jgi:endonuclease III